MPSFTPFSSSLDFGPDWKDDEILREKEQHRSECAHEIDTLNGSVSELMDWFGEGSPEWETIRAIVSIAATEKALMDLERQVFEISPI